MNIHRPRLACFSLILTWNYFEGIIKQLLTSAFVGYEEFCRSRRELSTEAEGIANYFIIILLNLILLYIITLEPARINFSETL